MKAKKFLALLLAVVLVFSLGITAFATNSDTEKGSIEVMNPQTGVDYTASKIFGVTYDGDKYSYTIDANSPWLSAVQTFATDTTPAGATEPVNSDGLTLTPVKDKTGTVVSYNVAFNEDFSAADFAAAMKAANVTDSNAVTLAKSGDTAKAENLDLGYWLVLPSTGALANLTTTDKDVQVYDKNEKPAVDKEIKDTTVDADKKNNASVGDKVPYTLTTKVPDMTGYTKYFFVVKDTMSKGLTFNNDVVVTLDGTPLTAGTDYTVVTDTDEDDNTIIKIVFSDMVNKRANDVGKEIVVTYSATLNENALINAANTNTAEVLYSNDPSINPESDPNNPPENPDDPEDPDQPWNKGAEGREDPFGDGPDSTTETWTTELNIQKYANEIADANKLAGAKFKLEGTAENQVKVTGDNYVPYVAATGEGATQPTAYWELKDGTYTTTDPASVTMKAAPTDYDRTKGGYVVCASTDEGAVQVGDKYYREATNTELEGTVDLYIKITPDQDDYKDTTKKYMKETATWYETKTENVSAEAFVDSTGKLVFSGLGAGTYTLTEVVVPDGYNPIDPITVTIVYDEKGEAEDTTPVFYIDELATKTEGENGATVVAENSMTMLENVINNSGVEMPETGGMGTTLLYVIGGILLVGAAIMLITKKRMSVEG